MGRVRSVCSARTVEREAARGALRALRAPVRSTLAVNCGGHGGDMEEGVVELINLVCGEMTVAARYRALFTGVYNRPSYPLSAQAYLCRKAHQPEAVCD